VTGQHRPSSVDRRAERVERAVDELIEEAAADVRMYRNLLALLPYAVSTTQPLPAVRTPPTRQVPLWPKIPAQRQPMPPRDRLGRHRPAPPVQVKPGRPQPGATPPRRSR
jgi:hypothetical protein